MCSRQRLAVERLSVHLVKWERWRLLSEVAPEEYPRVLGSRAVKRGEALLPSFVRRIALTAATHAPADGWRRGVGREEIEGKGVPGYRAKNNANTSSAARLPVLHAFSNGHRHVTGMPLGARAYDGFARAALSISIIAVTDGFEGYCLTLTFEHCVRKVKVLARSRSVLIGQSRLFI